jgi:hypothetical protein
MPPCQHYSILLPHVCLFGCFVFLEGSSNFQGECSEALSALIMCQNLIHYKSLVVACMQASICMHHTYTQDGSATTFAGVFQEYTKQATTNTSCNTAFLTHSLTLRIFHPNTSTLMHTHTQRARTCDGMHNINPFCNLTEHPSPYEWLKMVLIFPTLGILRYVPLRACPYLISQSRSISCAGCY